MKNKEILLNLVEADYEDDVIKILKAIKLWDNNDCWKVYGGRENNYSVIGNQQTDPEKALIENLVNSADAILMGRCKREGLNPSKDHSKTPKSIKEALQRYFEIKKEGGLSNLSSTQRTELAESCCGLIASGSKGKPSLAIFDFGEGQTPNSFEKTFLSLNESNKLSVPFVQGKFNQGSTGVLRFCGENGLKLIISKKDPKIESKETEWGFTIIRRFHPTEGSAMRSSTFKYLAPSGQILTVKDKSLNLLPQKYPAKSGGAMEYGTYIKLYEYDIGPGLKTNILFDLNYKLASLLVDPILPIRLYERRNFSGHTMETTLGGLELRLEEDSRDNVEQNFPVGGTFKTKSGTFSYKIYALKKEADKNKYCGNDGIIFAINGQAHGSLARSFFSRKDVGLSYLADSIIVNVDCSQLNSNAVERIFMTSRDRLGNGPETKEIEECLEDILKNNGNLRDLKNKRRKEELENQLSDNKVTKELFEKIIKSSPVLSKLLIQGVRIPDPFSTTTNSGGVASFVGKQHPTFFKLVKEFNQNKPKALEIGKKGRVQFETDVKNDYLDRTREKGDFKVWCKENNKIEILHSINPYNGLWTLNFALPDKTKVGSFFTIETELSDNTLVKPFFNSFVVELVDPIESKTRTPGIRRRKPDDDEGDDKGPNSLSLPNIIEVREQDWPQHKFDKYSALKCVNAGDEQGWDFYVNMDNIYLLSELKHSKIEKAVLEERFKLCHVFIGVALLSDFSHKKDQDTKSSTEENPEDRISNVSKAISIVILPLINQLADIGE